MVHRKIVRFIGFLNSEFEKRANVPPTNVSHWRRVCRSTVPFDCDQLIQTEHMQNAKDKRNSIEIESVCISHSLSSASYFANVYCMYSSVFVANYFYFRAFEFKFYQLKCSKKNNIVSMTVWFLLSQPYLTLSV